MIQRFRFDSVVPPEPLRNHIGNRVDPVRLGEKLIICSANGVSYRSSIWVNDEVTSFRMIPKIIGLPMLMDYPQVLVRVRNVERRKLQADHQIYLGTA